MIKGKRMKFMIIILVLSVTSLTFRPGLWLVNKPAASGNVEYGKGWADGCISGTNSYSLLYAPLLEKPFVKEADEVMDKESQANSHQSKSPEKNGYKMGWNEGFTLCRYYQSSVYELMQFAILITTLLFIGYLIAKPKNS
jgi:hypothetical protein